MPGIKIIVIVPAIITNKLPVHSHHWALQPVKQGVLFMVNEVHWIQMPLIQEAAFFCLVFASMLTAFLVLEVMVNTVNLMGLSNA